MKNPSPESILDGTFGRNLRFLLFTHGTRPNGSPGMIGRPWTATEFADRLGLSSRVVHGWLADQKIPADLLSLERILFGSNEKFDAWRLALRAAHFRGKARHMRGRPHPEMIKEIHKEVWRKTIDAKEQFLSSNAAPRLSRSIDRLVEALSAGITNLRPGILLMRFRSLEADAYAYDTQQGKQELSETSFSLLTDLVRSVEDLIWCYPQLAELEAKRWEQSSEVRGETLTAASETRLVEIGARLQSLSWLREGLKAARAVCRVLTPSGIGTGFVAPNGLVITCAHVVSDVRHAAETTLEFNFEKDAQGKISETSRYTVDPSTFFTSEALDCSMFRLREAPETPPLENWGTVNLITSVESGVSIGDHLSIIQHPQGGPKTIALNANQATQVLDHRIQYITDTLPGSSGAPVFNDQWQVVALHHANGSRMKSVSGEVFFANEGVLVQHILSNPELRENLTQPRFGYKGSQAQLMNTPPHLRPLPIRGKDPEDVDELFHAKVPESRQLPLSEDVIQATEARGINAWIEDVEPPLEIGQTYRLGVSAGELLQSQLTGAAIHGLASAHEEHIELLVVISGKDLSVQPRERTFKLQTRGNTQTTFFNFRLDGSDVTLRISLYLARELILLEEFEFLLPIHRSALVS